MGNPLLDRKSPPEWLASSQVIEFSEKISFFERLHSALENELSALEDADYPAGWRDERVSGRLEFKRSAAGTDGVWLEIEAKAAATLVCQRCLSAYVETLETALDVVLVGQDEQAEAGQEAWELEEPTLRPADIVDEALVMALPLSPLHEISACPAAAAEEEPAEREDTIKPFADLRAQMDKFGDE